MNPIKIRQLRTQMNDAAQKYGPDSTQVKSKRQEIQRLQQQMYDKKKNEQR